MLERYGGPAVFLGRFVAFARAIIPGLAGMSGLRYRVFLFYNALGGLIWGVGYTLLGYVVGLSFGRDPDEGGPVVAGRWSVVVVAIVVRHGLSVGRATGATVGERSRRSGRVGTARWHPGAAGGDAGTGASTPPTAARSA